MYRHNKLSGDGKSLFQSPLPPKVHLTEEALNGIGVVFGRSFDDQVSFFMCPGATASPNGRRSVDLSATNSAKADDDDAAAGRT